MTTDEKQQLMLDFQDSQGLGLLIFEEVVLVRPAFCKVCTSTSGPMLAFLFDGDVTHTRAGREQLTTEQKHSLAELSAALNKTARADTVPTSSTGADSAAPLPEVQQ